MGMASMALGAIASGDLGPASTTSSQLAPAITSQLAPAIASGDLGPATTSLAPAVTAAFPLSPAPTTLVTLASGMASTSTIGSTGNNTDPFSDSVVYTPYCGGQGYS